MWWMTAQVAAAWCESTIDTEPSGTDSMLVWPQGPAPTDTVVVIHVRRPTAFALHDPAGAAIAFTRYDLPAADPELAVLVPDAPLLPGAGYTVRTDPYDPYEVHDFVVGSDPAPVGTPPIPATRGMGAELVWLDADCPDDAFTETWLTYRLCNPPVITLVAIGDDEPPTPTLAQLGDAAPSTGDRVEIEGLSADLAATAWLGGFDAAGRFTGWTADPFVMPPPGTRTSERADGVSGGGSTTPTAFLTCPAAAVWVLETTDSCEQWDLDTRDCAVPAADTGISEPKSGCGCAAGPAPFGGLALGPLCVVGLVRRRMRP